MTTSDLLPSGATAFERAAAETMDATGGVSGGIAAMRTFKRVSIPGSLLPFLIYEYGLGAVSEYLPDADPLGAGIDWQRVRGTPQAVALALDWIGYEAGIEEAPTTRTMWHRFQLEMDRVRDAETPDLSEIAFIAQESVAVRSELFRAFHGYDVRPLEWSRSAYGNSMWSASSGVRIDGLSPKWSFGRGVEIKHEMTSLELTALGAWQPLTDTGLIGWGVWAFDAGGVNDLGWGNFSWESSDATWIDYGEAARLNLMASALAGRPVWAVFRDAGGDVIGYRRARAASPVTASPDGPYSVSGLPLTPYGLPTSFYVDAMTDFGDGAGQTAATVSLLFDAVPNDTAKPGLQWAGPGDLSAGTEFATHPFSTPFGETVRERVRFHLTF